MKRIIATMLAVILSVTAIALDGNIVAKAHSTTYKIEQNGGTCSGTAVAKHALLTATHCLEPTDEILVDGHKAHIAEIVSDPFDHSVLLLADVDFDKYSPIEESRLPQGSPVFIFGNPGGLEDMFRAGYVSGYNDGATLFDLNGFFGDSGSAIFDEHGRVAGVTSFIVSTTRKGVSIKYMGAYKFAFTARQWRYVQEFNPDGH